MLVSPDGKGRATAWRAQERRRMRRERVWDRRIRAELARGAAWIAEDARRGDIGPDSSAAQAHAQRLERLMVALWDESITSAASEMRTALALLRRQGSKDEPATPRVQRLRRRVVVQYAGKRARDLSAETVRQVNAAVLEGIAAGDGQEAAAKRVRQAAPDMARLRSRRIARTETHASHQAGNHASAGDIAQETGIALVQEWVAAQDPRTRESHRAADGQQVPMEGGRFQVGGASLAFPGDPSGPPGEVINCRCAVVYKVAKTAAASPLPPDFPRQPAAPMLEDPTDEQLGATARDNVRETLGLRGRARSAIEVTDDPDVIMPGMGGSFDLNTGQVFLLPSVVAEAKTALQSVQAGRALTVRQSYSLRTVYHEELHGSSPITPLAYAGIGGQLEEISTEILSRFLVRRHAPGSWPVAPPDADHMDDRRTYDDIVHAVLSIIAEKVSDWQAAIAALEAASLRFKMRAPRSIKTSDQARQAFADDLRAVTGEVFHLPHLLVVSPP